MFCYAEEVIKIVVEGGRNVLDRMVEQLWDVPHIGKTAYVNGDLYFVDSSVVAIKGLVEYLAVVHELEQFTKSHWAEIEIDGASTRSSIVVQCTHDSFADNSKYWYWDIESFRSAVLAHNDCDISNVVVAILR